MTALVLDPYTRTTSPGFGNEPLTGLAYTHTPNNTGMSTTGAVARIATATVNQLYYGTVLTTSDDHAVKVTITCPVLPTGAPITLRTVGRWTDANNYYEAQVSIAITTGAATLTIQKRVAGVLANIAGPTAITGTHVAGNAWTTVLEVYGSTVRARAWNASTGSDPGTWQVSGTNSELPTGKQVGWGTRRETGNTNGSQNIDADNLSADTLITVIEQDVWPTRVLVAVTGILVGDSVAIYRQVGTERVLVQNGSTTSSTDVAFLRVDGQLPFGVPVSYVAVINNDETDTPAITYVLDGGKVAITDAITGLAAEVVIWAWPDKIYDRSATAFSPGNRNVVVSGDFGQFESDLEVYVDATSSADNLKEVLTGATQGIVQLRQPGGYDDVDCYVVVTQFRPRRWAQDGSDQKRIFAMHVIEVDPWASGLSASGFTYQDLADAYAGLAYSNVAADYATYLLLAEADLS
jgi:hypothetical protein